MNEHKPQPSYGQNGITSPWGELSPDTKKGLEIAAYICRMYGEGETFAKAILCRGEQISALWHMENERQSK